MRRKSVLPNLVKESGVGKTYDDPSRVGAENGEVTVNGPDGVAVSLTPEAALETGDRLIASAAEAHGQKVREDETKRQHKEAGLDS